MRLDQFWKKIEPHIGTNNTKIVKALQRGNDANDTVTEVLVENGYVFQFIRLAANQWAAEKISQNISWIHNPKSQHSSPESFAEKIDLLGGYTKHSHLRKIYFVNWQYKIDQEMLAGNIPAVSYTHLTLPTIYSV